MGGIDPATGMRRPAAENRNPATPVDAEFAGEELLRTRRMRLRGLCARDLPDLLRLGQEPRVGAWLLDHPLASLGQVCNFIAWVNTLYVQRPGLGIWHARDREDAFLGFFSLMPECDTGEISIGTRLLPRAWGRGYALEGGEALCEHAFTTLGLPLLIGLCDPCNRSVPPLLARLGFVADGQMRQEGKPALRFVLRRESWTGIRRRVRPRPAQLRTD